MPRSPQKPYIGRGKKHFAHFLPDFLVHFARFFGAFSCCVKIWTDGSLASLVIKNLLTIFLKSKSTLLPAKPRDQVTKLKNCILKTGNYIDKENYFCSTKNASFTPVYQFSCYHEQLGLSRKVRGKRLVIEGDGINQGKKKKKKIGRKN